VTRVVDLYVRVRVFDEDALRRHLSARIAEGVVPGDDLPGLGVIWLS
jgi:hypothetical protein